jgi:NAD-dependent DNA ligase
MDRDYFKYTSKARLGKAINTLLGMLEGISMDSKISQAETQQLSGWLDQNKEFRDRHPFNEIMPAVELAISDGHLDEDENSDLLWLCRKLQSTEYYDSITADIQSLHGLLAGIVADGRITEQELEGLSIWMADHEHLQGCWPYDEVHSLTTAILADHKIDDLEQQRLKTFFNEFVSATGDRSIGKSIVTEGSSIKGICAVCPQITFENCVFCFTGESKKYSRQQCFIIVDRLKGKNSKNVTKQLNYLVIGAISNPCWSYACYGRKVERAVELRKQGHNILLVHENDFVDAVLDSGVAIL